MKLKLLYILAALIFFSCSTSVHLEKRKYRKGWHFTKTNDAAHHKRKKVDQKESDNEVVESAEIKKQIIQNPNKRPHSLSQNVTKDIEKKIIITPKKAPLKKGKVDRNKSFNSFDKKPLLFLEDKRAVSNKVSDDEPEDQGEDFVNSKSNRILFITLGVIAFAALSFGAAFLTYFLIESIAISILEQVLIVLASWLLFLFLSTFLIMFIKYVKRTSDFNFKDAFVGSFLGGFYLVDMMLGLFLLAFYLIFEF